MRFALAFAILLALAGSAAHAQSFDCAKARIASEFAICDDARLGRLDEEMSALYFGLPVVVRNEIAGSQRLWLRRRNACGYDVVCIEDAYLRRIEVLSQF